MSRTADTDLLRAIDAKLDRLLAAVEGRRDPARPLRHQDQVAMAEILPVLAAHFDGSFACWELIDAAGAQDATGANLRLVLGGRTAQRLGKLFSRCADQDIGGFRLRRTSRDGNGTRWQVGVSEDSTSLHRPFRQGQNAGEFGEILHERVRK
jgi:hypothetical protein